MANQIVQVHASTQLLPERKAVIDKAFQRFLKLFIEVANEVTRYVTSAAARSNADRSMKTYATLLKKVWSGNLELTSAPSEVDQVDAAYFTLRSFLTLSEATTPASRLAKASGEAALQSIAEFIGEQALWDIETAVETQLQARRLKSLGRNLRGGPGSMAAWDSIGRLSKRPPQPYQPERDITGSHSFAVGNFGVEAVPPPPSAKEKSQQVVYDVWFGTNRRPVDAANPAAGFTNERDPQGTVHYGVCSVNVPRTHIFGSTGTNFIKRWLKLKFTDDHLTLGKIQSVKSEADFVKAMRKELAAREEDERVVLVYIHGYNNSFKDAAICAAQIGFDLKIPGVTAFYSWPSNANIIKYLPDRERVEASEKQIADFLTTIATRVDATKVHVIAHSMGNRGFARAISRVVANAAATGKVKFGQIILAAADLGVDLFNQLAAVYPTISERTSLYVSSKDKALWAARFLQDADRIGYKPPITVVDGIDTVDVSDIDLSLLGHGYIAEAAPVLYDIQELINANTPPQNRLRTQASINQAGKPYWVIAG